MFWADCMMTTPVADATRRPTAWATRSRRHRHPENHLVGRTEKAREIKGELRLVVNTAFYPSLMWNGRFSAPSGDPFDNSLGFLFPPPEGSTKFPARDPVIAHLLIAQAHFRQQSWWKSLGLPGTAGMIAPPFRHLR